MWREAIILVVVAVGMGEYNFDPHDQNDYVDEPEEPPDTDPLLVSDIASLGTTTKGIHGEVEKLLGQPIFHYEDPVTTPASPPSRSQPQNAQRKGSEQKEESLKDSEEIMPKHESPLEENQNSESKEKVSPHRTSEQSSKVSKKDPERTHTVRGHIGSEWRHEVTTHESTPIHSIELSVTKPRRRPKLKIKSSGQPIQEAVYTIEVPWEAEHKKIGRGPGLIESIVGSHDIVHRELSGLAGARSPHKSTFLPMKDDPARRYLITIPKDPNKFTTRPPRPTPTTQIRLTTYKYSRITRRHQNCTDSYYNCLLKCFDRRGYRVRCPWYTPTKRAQPARMNLTGLYRAVTSNMWEWDTSNLIKKFREIILEKGYRDCKCTTTTTTTTTTSSPAYYDDIVTNKTGEVMAKCWVCGLLDQGVPTNSYCADNFGNLGNSLALAEKASYRKNCRYMDEIPLWYNHSDPFSIYGTWTGGCSTRWIDLSGLYTQRTCRSEVHPAMGQHFLSRRMAMLELALRGEKNGCVVSPMATLVPFSRAISLYARIHVCVCNGTFCNGAPRLQRTESIGTVVLTILYSL